MGAQILEWRRFRHLCQRVQTSTGGGTKARQVLSDRYLSRLTRLAWLAPDVLERLVVRREPCAITIYELCLIASRPWEEQVAKVFE